MIKFKNNGFIGEELYWGARGIGSRVIIGVKFLRLLINHPNVHDSIVFYKPVLGGADEITWKGSIEDLLRSAGREEMDHIIYEYRHNPTWRKVLFGSSFFPNPAFTKQSVYDAQDHEYYALGTQSHLMADSGAPGETVNVLKQRLKAVIEQRRQDRLK